MNVAIIDDGIDEITIDSCNDSIMNLISQGGKISPTKQFKEPTHGGLCSEVFWETTGRLPDVSICLPKDNKGRCNVNDLALALDWCVSNSIDLINLSMGTTRFFDSFILRNIMESLNNSGTVLVAGSNNKGLITFPAAFDSCIGVCCEYGMKTNEIAYIEKPFDGIKIATYPIRSNQRNIIGTNSLSTAYISGIIYNELGSDLSIDKVHRFFRDKSIRITDDWKCEYLKQKISRTPKYESIVIQANSQSHKQTTEYITELRKHIINDEYTCAILSDNTQNIPSDYVFSFESSPLSRSDTLEFITKSSRSNIILTDSKELISCADIIVYNNVDENYDILEKTKCFRNLSAYDVWNETKKIYE